MDNMDVRLEIVNQARRILMEENHLSSDEFEDVLSYSSVLIEEMGGNCNLQSVPEQARKLANDLIQSRSLLLTIQQQADELDALKRLSLNLTSSLDLQTVLDAVVMEAVHLVKNANLVHIFLYMNEKLEFGAALNKDGVCRKPIYEPRENGLTFTVARSGEQIIVEDMSNHPIYANAPKTWTGSIIGIPLKIDDRVVGVMSLSRSTVGGFSFSELRLLGLLSDQAAVAISNARLHLMVSKQAHSDTLTGLPNRRALDDRLEHEVVSARRAGYVFAVVMMDLDGFKIVNDTHGHSVGDQVLRAVFNYLATGLRTSDFLARYGGDELTLVLSQTDPSAARLVVDKIMEKVHQFSFNAPGGKKIRLGLSAGIAFFPLHAVTSSDLLRAADEALYRAKKQRRGSYIVAGGFTGELHQEIT